MMTFGSRSLWESIKYRFSRRYREESDARTREAIRWLLEHPEAPCKIDGHVIPNGYGNTPPR